MRTLALEVDIVDGVDIVDRDMAAYTRFSRRRTRGGPMNQYSRLRGDCKWISGNAEPHENPLLCRAPSPPGEGLGEATCLPTLVQVGNPLVLPDSGSRGPSPCPLPQERDSFFPSAFMSYAAFSWRSAILLSSPGGEGRVRGLFPGIAEETEQRSKTDPPEMDPAPIYARLSLRSPRTTHVERPQRPCNR